MRDDFYFGMTRREKVLIKVDIFVCCWGHSSQTDWWILPDTPRADNVSDDLFLSSTKNSFCLHQHSPKLRPCTPKTSWPTREREAGDAPSRWIPSPGIFANFVKKFPPWKSAFDQHAKKLPHLANLFCPPRIILEIEMSCKVYLQDATVPALKRKNLNEVRIYV